MITTERPKFKTITQVFAYQNKVAKLYAELNKEILNEEVNEQEYLDSYTYEFKDFGKHSIELLNKALKQRGCNIVISALDKNVKDQVAEYFKSLLTKSLEEVIEDSIEFLCSNTKMSENKIKEYFMNNIMSDVTKDMTADKIESTNIEYLLEIEKTFNEKIETETRHLISIIEDSKKQPNIIKNTIEADSLTKQESDKKEEQVIRNPKEENQKIEHEENKKESIKSSDNFVPEKQNKSNGIIDVDYQEVSLLTDQDKNELRNQVSECSKFYTNKDKLTMMLGGNSNKAQEILPKVIERINKMNASIVNNKSKQDIANILSQMQIELIDMINSYNPAIKSTLNIIDLFKDVEVDTAGEAIRVEDFFGNFYRPQDLIENNDIIDSILRKNSVILQKINSNTLRNTIDRIQQQTGTVLRLEEVKAPYREVNSILKATPIVKESEINRYFYIDIYGTLFTDSPKFIILNNSDIIDEGYYIDIERTDLIIKYIYGTISKEELDTNDIINPRLRTLNVIVDISSIHKKNKQMINNILLEQKSLELLRRARELDKSCRFRLEELTKYTFTMISDSRTKTHFTGETCKRKKMRLVYDLSKEELILIENVK